MAFLFVENQALYRTLFMKNALKSMLMIRTIL
jgi:hypothetical protein